MSKSEMMLLVFNMTVFFSFLAWLLKFMLDMRKVRAKTELNKILIDRFGEPDALKRFLDSENGRIFVNTLSITERSWGTRIMLNVKAGLIMVFLAPAFLVVAGIFKEEARYINALGIIVFSLACGYLTSSWFSSRLRQRWNMDGNGFDRD